MKVIIYEGLFGILLGSKMSKAFEEACPGVKYERRSWTSKKPIPEGAVVLGHSFGAYTALKKCREYLHYDKLITVDVRWWHRNKDYAHLGLIRQHNFLQLKGLRGYRMISPRSETNLGYYGHMKAPSHPLVIEKIREVCGEA